MFLLIMKKNNIMKSFIDDKFALYTSITSVVMAALFFWKGCKEQFYLGSIIFISLNLLYIPLILIFNKKLFPYFELIYGLYNIFFIAFHHTLLYNNFSAFFIMCIIILIKPAWKYFVPVIYLVVVSIAFALNDELIYHYLIHIVRAAWFYGVVAYVISTRYEHKNSEHAKLNLTQDEIQILKEMKSGKKQKEVECFSINTVTKKLNAAKTRNNIGTTTELLLRFIDDD